jgi:hypothetical protein
MRFDASEFADVRQLFKTLGELSDKVRMVIDGHVDATIYGTYFGHALSDDRKLVLQEIALEHLAEQMFKPIDSLCELDIIIKDDRGSPLYHVLDIQNMVKRMLAESRSTPAAV